MKVLATLLLVCAACGGDDIELYPISPGGGGPGGLSLPDASDADGDSGVPLAGRVCLVTDARTPTNCANIGADGLTVTLGMRTAITAADGTFSINVVTGTANVWRVTGTDIVSSAMAVGSPNIIPVISSALYAQMVSDSVATAPTGRGAIIAKLTTNDVPRIGATAVATGTTSVLYDGANATNWLQGATGNLGVVWTTDLAAGTATLTIDTAELTQQTVANIPVFADTITWLFVDVP
jgi:hypothetical protein